MTDDAYSLPQIYDLAFSFRDYAKAVDFLIEAARQAGYGQIGSMVELGCGPAQYCREFARRGVESYGVDLSPQMVGYAGALCEEEQLPCRIVEADMRKFTLPRRVDLACCMMATFHLLLTNDDIVTHLQAVAENLTDRGLYIIELSHPKDFLGKTRSARNIWTMDEAYASVTTDWGSDAVVDPLTEIVSGTVRFTVKRPMSIERHEFREQWREISAGLITALVRLSGAFSIVGWYGDLDITQPFDNSDRAWRMVLVLQRV